MQELYALKGSKLGCPKCKYAVLEAKEDLFKNDPFLATQVTSIAHDYREPKEGSSVQPCPKCGYQMPLSPLLPSDTYNGTLP